MKLLIDYVPIAVFFGVYVYSKDLMLATAVLIPATGLQVLLSWKLFGKVEKMHLLTFGIVLVMGALTLALDNPLFIKWKPTVAYSVLALGLVGNLLWARKPVLQAWLGTHVELETYHWRRISWAWAVFFLFSAGLNLLVVYNFSTEVWVHYKLYGQLLVTLVFMLGQGLYIYKKANPEAAGAQK